MINISFYVDERNYTFIADAVRKLLEGKEYYPSVRFTLSYNISSVYPNACLSNSFLRIYSNQIEDVKDVIGELSELGLQIEFVPIVYYPPDPEKQKNFWAGVSGGRRMLPTLHEEEKGRSKQAK